jgi:ribosomal protein L3 glutamine methyltransferase
MIPFLPQRRTIGDLIEEATRRFKAADLAYGHGTGGPFDEAAFLVLETLGLPPDADLNRIWRKRPNAGRAAAIAAVIAARISTRKPAPYLVNKAYIQGVPFYVDERVIVPRSFIGEILCGMGEVPGFIGRAEDIRSVLDLCTGSGCLAVLAARVFPNAKVDAVELSPGAAEVARRNIAQSGHAARIELLQGDLFAPAMGRAYDLIITNPPYVDAEGMEKLPPEYRHEPEMALASGADGLDLTRRILAEAPAHLNEGGGLLCEIGRCGPALKAAYPGTDFLWVDTETSSGEVFWLPKKDFPEDFPA